MDNGNSVELTEEEAELYDRQIRLWGLESQKRLRAARILLAGLNGLGAEVAKNVILSGVKSMTLLDDEVVTEVDKCSQFFTPHDSLGKNRAEASLKRAQALNPMVAVIADTSSLESKESDFYNDFDVVVIIKASIEQLTKINNICREKKIKFFCGDVWGMFGYTFADLQTHDFVEDVVSHKPVAKPRPGVKGKSETITTTTKRSLTFVPLQRALELNLASGDVPKRLKRNGPAYLAMQVLQTFRSKHSRDPKPESKVDDIKELNELRLGLLKKNNIDESLFPADFFTHIFAQISPACAIVGGVLAQEIIKAVSHKEPPHDNLFFFDPHRCAGFIERVH